MAPNRSKSRYAIKECSTCGSWYTKECCSIGNLNDQIIIPVPDSSQHCAVCGTPVDGPYCHGCTLIRKKFEKELFAYCVDNGVFQNFQDTPESSNDNTNVLKACLESQALLIKTPVSDKFSQLPAIFPMLIRLPSSKNGKAHAQTISYRIYANLLKKYDHRPHMEKSSQGMLAEEKFLKIKQVKDQEEKSTAELLAEEKLQKANQVLNESQSPQEIRIQDFWRYKKHSEVTSRLAHLAPISPEIVEACVDDDDTDDDDDYDDDFYDCVDIEEERRREI
ncbi:copia protein [Tanacetum coccineum]